MGHILTALAILVGCYIAYEAGRFYLLIQKGAAESRAATAYQQEVADSSMKILVIGDSTAVGTGADDPQNSVAGRLGTHYPDAHIENRGENGLKTAELVTKFEELPEEAHYDLILVQIGGNDILQFTSLSSFRSSLDTVLRLAAERSDSVILMSTGNVGAAPAFSPLFASIYTTRTKQVRELFIVVAKENDVPYVDLFTDPADDPFVQDPDRYHAPDGLHPSDDGYGVWFSELEKAL